jgi:3' exoribonuclease family, domain 1
MHRCAIAYALFAACWYNTHFFSIMGKQIPLRTTFALPDGREVALETGKLAAQADGSVLVRLENTMLLATIVFPLIIRKNLLP